MTLKPKKELMIKMTQETLKSKFEELAENYKQLNVKTIIFSIFKLNLNILLFFSLTSFIVNSIDAKQVVGPSSNVMINSIILGILSTFLWLIYYVGWGEYGIPTPGYVNREEFNYVALEYYQKVSSLYDKIWKVVRRIHNLLSIFTITLFWYLLQYQNLDKDLVNINELFSFRERKHIACIVLLITNTLIPLSKKYLNQLFKALKHTFKRKFLTEFEPFLDQEKYIQKPNEHDNVKKKRNNHIKGLIVEAYIGFSGLTSYGFFLFMVYEKLKESIETTHNTTRGQMIFMPIILLLIVTPIIVWEQIYKD